MDSRAFYDSWVARQVAVGVNARHRSILEWLHRFGLRPNHRILEIGCGVGTLTELVASSLGVGGSILAVDLSPKSIDAARSRLAAYGNVQLEAGDILKMEIEGRFDVLVLPDVIEHIPLEDHPMLFSRLARWVAPEGFILLHYPNPLYLEWCHQHIAEQLQFIDQPIHADVLTANAYKQGLWLEFLKTYAIWIREGDYVVAVLRPRAEGREFTTLPEKRPSLAHRVRATIGRMWS